ncbi:MAG: LicD family protein [Candidatus Gastranaerophilales bacterium]|nr:LicD family protein [Candidatus Gastranaerophilales bacterium]
MKIFDKQYDSRSQHFIYRIFGLKFAVKNKETQLIAKLETLQTIVNLTDIRTLSKASGKIREVQNECHILLKRFNKICKKNNFEYWLDSGTLLGAVRHKGFVPWDDDIDLCMLRDDYEKIIPILKEEFKDSEYIVREKCERTNFFHIRILQRDNQDIGIDIFPVDKFSKNQINEIEKKNISDKIREARKLLEKKYPKKSLKHSDIKNIRNDIINLQNKIVMDNQNCHETNPCLFFGIEFPYRPKHHLIMEYDMVFPLKELEFEGEYYTCPAKSEEYLKNLYDNFLQMPNNIRIKFKD